MEINKNDQSHDDDPKDLKKGKEIFSDMPDAIRIQPSSKYKKFMKFFDNFKNSKHLTKFFGKK